ncbi:MAG: ribosome biogenesis GTPase Der [Kiritimatiellae bacterium]|nr:ribosome biogenesis GTPase Der [Kiritimatiellia bacterium]
MKRRMAVIVGRPNVGKSTIFNRLVGRRIAIVHPERGVTRDRLMSEAEWNGQRFSLVDTGGICPVAPTDPRAEILRAIRHQVDIALAEASVAIMVADVEAGPHPLDEEVVRLLRKAHCPSVVAVNKCDNEDRDALVGEFAKWGLPVFAVSALHNRGFEPMMRAVLQHLPPAQEEATPTEAIRVAVVGRPNVGKSSYINRLLRADRLIVSPIPGTTRDSVDIPFATGHGPQTRHYVLIDTAGIRHRTKIHEPVERFSLLRAAKSIARSHVCILMLDASQGPTAQDKRIAGMIQEHQRGCVLVVNKWDLATFSQRQATEAIRAMMPFMGYCPIVFVSALTGYNIRRSIKAVELVAEHIHTRLPTPILNRTIIEACERVRPPLTHGQAPKIRYATQTGVNPIRVRIFADRACHLSASYRDYLANTIRRRFALEGAAVVLDFVEN